QDILDTQGEIGVQIGNALTETENIKSLVTNNQVVTNVDFGSYKESTSTQITEQAEDIKSRGIKVEQFIPNITETEDKWDWRAAILNAVNYAHVNKITKVIFPAKDIIIRQQLEISNLEQTTIEMSKSKITFSSNSSSNQGALSAIIFRNLSDCVVTEAYLDIEVNEQQYNGIQVINSKRTRFIKPKVLNATWVGFSIYDNGEITSEDIVLDDPVLEYCRYGLLEHGLRTVVNRGFISNHWSESLEAKVQGEKPIWTEESKFWDGVIVRGRDWEFNKTVIKDNGQSGIYSGQTVGGSLNGVIIEGNWNKGVDFGATKTDVSSIREVTIDGSCVIRNNRTGDVHLYNTDYVTILPGAIIERTDNTYDDYDKYSQACIILNSDSAHNNISEVIVNQ
ncbi:hypothetical protein ABZ737_33960, partial [Streptomyces sp. NPDC013087]|uniref:hypothetical protein n=1 Tax=Streptomyces sp. NPDC013087 TaxID=3156694 RepID=UPI00340B74FB